MKNDIKSSWEGFQENGDTYHRNLLVESYFPIVKSTAENMRALLPHFVALGDLENAGMIGLIEAVENFDPCRGVKFETFCRPRIRGAILDELRGLDRLSRAFRGKIHRLERAAEKLRRKLDRQPTECEVAQALGVSIDQVRKTLRGKEISVYSLDAARVCRRTGEEMNPIELVADERGIDPVKVAQSKELTEKAARMLNEVERHVVLLYYYDQLTMKEIGEILNLTESRVCQIHKRLIGRLRRGLA